MSDKKELKEHECPKCGANLNMQDDAFGVSNVLDHCVVWNYTCKCGHEGKQIYNLIFSHHEEL